ELSLPENAHLTWIHRSTADGAPGEALVAAVKALDFPPGRVHAFLHGEAMTVKPLRSFLRFDKEIPREDLSVSGYWRRGNNDERWRARKKQWKAEVEAEETAHQPAGGASPATPLPAGPRAAPAPAPLPVRHLARRIDTREHEPTAEV